MVIDWSAIEADYITGNLSYRQIAQKYNIDNNTIANRGKLEHWVERRKDYKNKFTAKLIQNAEKSELKLMEKVCNVADKLLKVLDKTADKMIETTEKGELVHPSLIKPMTAALKDIKEIQNRPTEADIREQEARIKALESKLPNVEAEELGVIVMPERKDVDNE